MAFRPIVLAIAIALTGCSGVQTLSKPKTTAVVLAPIAAKTYAYEATVSAPPGHTQSPEVQVHVAKVKEQIDVAMSAKGYTLSPTPHLRVRISIGLQRVKDPTAVPGATADPTVLEHTLQIDVFDHTTGSQLFRGGAVDALRQRASTESKIADAVQEILEPVPPASG